MKNIIAVLLLGLGLVLAIPASAEITGTTIEGKPACIAEELDSDAKALLNLWLSLNQKLEAGTITDEESEMGLMLINTGACGLIVGDVAVKVVVLDGVDYLIELPGHVRLIIKSDGVLENE